MNYLKNLKNKMVILETIEDRTSVDYLVKGGAATICFQPLVVFRAYPLFHVGNINPKNVKMRGSKKSKRGAEEICHRKGVF